MFKTNQKTTSYLAVLLLVVTVFFVSGLSFSGKTALGSSGFNSVATLENTAANPLAALAKKLASPIGVLGNSNGTEGNVKTNDFDIVAAQQKVQNLRIGLPSKLRREGNAAVADINIEGISTTKISAHSRVDDLKPNYQSEGLVGKGSQNFEYQTIPDKKGNPIPRNTDSEYKILDNLADQLGSNTNAKGTVNIFTERPACGSCQNVAEQFMQRYPNIKVVIRDNNGVIVRPSKQGK